ncbi:amino acid ABC transporter permease [Haematospirillum jordaniae]|uniref:Amino acid ABC transporter permease n=1 Tax=Haematospirillum jordaniae TaxID=1549855 RepID=A0A143DDY0_9PROT|nr:amino acid ABC transporter permease [Haematospirillum jordaniae]AMW34915.1 amino acid ABC transporter permease [Haematospirillum jordaniae]NKD45719.1 amino acid ABC transporter permease [Haematospirillum jordaniae]NKD56745.1 amino acid ABC transporter permease [Haematospirillum jordaniae]NKD59099.1 amino acid ABC transporter permease [Haematospirillum jordaniae]NKD67858.1 amino acid ABC transporter permease [Haematospirillum jordaniae]
MSEPGKSRSGGALLNDVRIRGIIAQVLVLGAVSALIAWLVHNTLSNLAALQIATGYGFLEREAAFDISESVIQYSPADTYLRVLAAGLLNTLKVSLIGIILATLIGTLFGIARLSSNWIIARIAGIYVEGLRNIPLLLQLFFWYALITEALPNPKQALQPLEGVFLSNRGIKIPWPVWETGHTIAVVGFFAALVVAFFLNVRATRIQNATGQRPGVLLPALGLMIIFPVLGWLAGGAPTEISTPVLRGFNFRGGANLSPEFTALLTGLTLYTGTFIAEIVRGGISAVPWGQTEAAVALGLKRSRVMRLILLPQALRVIIPPLTSQYLNLVKNSSLAVAIGYPDLVSVANTAINQTGQAVEGVAIIMAVYLTISLSISAFMNWYNSHIALRGGR